MAVVSTLPLGRPLTLEDFEALRDAAAQRPGAARLSASGDQDGSTPASRAGSA